MKEGAGKVTGSPRHLPDPLSAAPRTSCQRKEGLSLQLHSREDGPLVPRDGCVFGGKGRKIGALGHLEIRALE